jgi:hypothetical protein
MQTTRWGARSAVYTQGGVSGTTRESPLSSRLRRVATALMTSLLLSLFGPVELVLAAVAENGANEDNPVTAASASPATTNDATGGPPDTGGGGGGPQSGGQSSAAQNADNGPGQGPSHVQGSNVPTQDSSSTSDATVDNGAAVGQSSDQSVIGPANGSDHAAPSSQGDVTGQGQGAGHGQGQGEGQGNSNGQGNAYGHENGHGQGEGQGNGNGHGNGQAAQQAHAGQQANASATAASSGSTNDAATVLVGPAAAGDTGATMQTNATTADANATAAHEAAQDSGAGGATTQTTAEQSAAATAQAQATDPENTAVTVRIEAPGNDGGVTQANVTSASSDAVTHSQGSDTSQQANAVSQAQLESPANTAVELRVYSDGDSAGAEQINSSSASAATTTDDSAGQATANATLTDPSNTFVSIRVNSNGSTGASDQQNVAQESENGVIATASDTDHATGFVGGDDTSGLAIAMTTDGANTDLRIAVESAGLDRPSAGSTFTWTWDLVVGDEPLACNIASSSTASRVDWTFDCDPNNLIVREPGSAPQGVANAITWSWDWSRPGLPGWDWTRDFTITLPDCSGCTYIFDFKWITHEPTAPAGPGAEGSSAAATGPVSIQQLNQTSASASANAGSSITQSITQTSQGNSERTQVALQQAGVVQTITAAATAELRNAKNHLVIAHGIATQWNWAEAVVIAGASAEIWQYGEQHQSGNGSFQMQQILQSAQFTQVVSAIGAAAVREGYNSSTSRRGDGIQSTSSTAFGNGRAEASTHQAIVQEQFGNGSDQAQIAAQWATVVQNVDVQAAAALAIAKNETRLYSDAMNQRTRTAATSRSSAAASIKQTALQYQDADGLTQSQESYQLATVGQTGAAQARAEAGQITHRYATPPAGAQVPPIESGSGWTESDSSVSGTTRIVVISSNGVTEISVNGTPVPVALPPRALIVSLTSLLGSVATDAPATELTFSQGLTSTDGPLAGTLGVEKADGSSPRFPGLAPEHLGATAASAGTGGLGVLAALMALSLIRLPQRGGRMFSPAGRRPAAALLQRERPG